MFENKRLFVHIEGMEMQNEAWELIRLFFDAESIEFISAESMPVILNHSLLLTLDTCEDESGWKAKACLFSGENAMKPELEETIQLSHEDFIKPGGSLLKSRKILCGNAIYKLLSRLCDKKLPYGSLTGVRPAKLATLCLEDGLDAEGAKRLLIKVSGMHPQKAGLLTDVALNENKYLGDASSVNIYIGIPFCASRCLYCSFTAYPIERFKNMVDPYFEALEKELSAGGHILSCMNKKISSIYIGGGTPTAIDAKSLDRLLLLVKKHIPLKGAPEYTVEAGRPDTIDGEKLEIILNGGASRISINPQTMNKDTLRLIGRNHSPDDIKEKYELARKIGFKNINMDIIAGLPEEDLRMFLYTLDEIEEMAPESLTVHTLSIKRAAKLNEDKNSFINKNDLIVEKMIESARERAYHMGMKPYYLYRQKNIMANLENTGYARQGFECIYNIQTMEEKQSILAFGAGAVSKFVFADENRIERAFNVKEVNQYISRIDEMIDRKMQIIGTYNE